MEIWLHPSWGPPPSGEPIIESVSHLTTATRTDQKVQGKSPQVTRRTQPFITVDETVTQQYLTGIPDNILMVFQVLLISNSNIIITENIDCSTASPLVGAGEMAQWLEALLHGGLYQMSAPFPSKRCCWIPSMPSLTICHPSSVCPFHGQDAHKLTPPTRLCIYLSWSGSYDPLLQPSKWEDCRHVLPFSIFVHFYAFSSCRVFLFCFVFKF